MIDLILKAQPIFMEMKKILLKLKKIEILGNLLRKSKKLLILLLKKLENFIGKNL